MGVASRRQREKNERREEILDAAEQVFFAGGYQASTMDDIAQAVELSKGALYLYFKSKDELYLGIVTRHQARLVAALEKDTQRGLDGLALFRAVAETFVRHARENPDHTRMVLTYLATGQQVPSDTPVWELHRQLAERELQIVLSSLELGMRDGSMRPDVNAKEVAMHLWGGLMGMLLLEINEERMREALDDPPEPSISKFVDLLTRDIAAEAAE